MKRLLVGFFVYVSIVNTCIAGEITYEKGWWSTSYKIDGKSASFGAVRNELNDYEPSKNELDGYYGDVALSLLMIPGAGMVGSEAGGSAGGGDTNGGILVGGVALIGLGIYYSRKAEGRMYKAINVYNDKSSSKLLTNKIAFAVTPLFIGVSVKF